LLGRCPGNLQMANTETENIKYFKYLEEFEQEVERMIKIVEKQRKKRENENQE